MVRIKTHRIFRTSGLPLTFALVGGVGGEGVAVETVLAAVAEEAVGVVDALQALSGLAVAVANSIGVDVVAALAGAAGSDRAALTQRVAEETVITELAAFTCRQVTSQDGYTIVIHQDPERCRRAGGPSQVCTCGSGGTVGADDLSGLQDDGAGRSGRTRTWLTVT